MKTEKKEKFNKTLVACAVVLLLAAVLCAVGAVFANWMTLTLTYNASSSQDTLELSVSGTTVTVDRTRGGDYHYVHVDVVIFSSEDDLTFLRGGVALASDKYLDEAVAAGVSNCYVLRGLALDGDSLSFTSSVAVNASTCFAYPADESNGTTVVSYNNTYVSSFYELQAASGEHNHNVVGKLTTDTNVFHTLYFVSAFDITADFVYNLPCSIHLFYSDIRLQASFTINHNYGGNYVIDTKGGVFYADSSKQIEVIAPNAFIRVGQGLLGTNVSSIHNFKNSEQEITTQYARDSIASFISQATNYILEYLPSRITNNVIMPGKYQQTGVSFAFSVQNAQGDSFNSMYADGTVYRDVITHTVTINVEMEYSGIYKTIALQDSTPTCTAVCSKTVTVVGTGAAAVLEELSFLLDDEIHADAAQTQLGGNTYFAFAQDASIGILLQKYLRDNPVASPVTISVEDINGSFFRIVIEANEFYTNSLTLTTDGGLCTGEFSFLHNGETVSGNINNNGIYLRPSTYIINGSELTVLLEAGGETELVSWLLSGMDEAEQRLYLDSLVTIPAFAYDSETHTTSFTGILGVLSGEQADNKLYRYDLALDSTNAIFEYGALGVLSTDVIIFNAGSSASFTALSQNAELQSELATLWQTHYRPNYATMRTVSFGSFTRHLLVNDAGVISGSYLSTSLTGAPASTYAMVQRFVFENGGEYYALRRVVFSSAGYGESGNQQHYTDDTFAGFYADNVMTDGKLLESNSFVFDSTDLGFNIFLYLDPSLRDFCYVDYATNGTEPYVWQAVDLSVSDGQALAQLAAGKYSIHIDMSKLPARNINTMVTVYFYYTAQRNDFLAFARTDIGRDTSTSYFATQSYTFTLPGVYHCGAGKSFESSVLYNYLLSLTDNGENVFNSYLTTTNEGTNGYLYTDGIDVNLPVLDLSSTAYGSVQSINIKGIEFLSGVQRLIFDGMNLSGLDALGRCTHTQSLSMRGCSLTDALVGSNLYGMTSLASADLSNNALTRVYSGDNGIFYRKITHLTLSNNDIVSLEGVEYMYALEELELSGNNIAYFAPLLELAKLKKVNIAQNTPPNTVLDTVGGYTALGTSGILNIPVYSTLRNVQEARIYIVGSGFSTATELTLVDNDFYLDADFSAQTVTSNLGYKLLTSRQVASLILNGVDYDQTFESNVTFNLTVYWESQGGNDFTVSNVQVASQNLLLDENFAQATSFSSGDTIYAVVYVDYSFSLTVSGVTTNYNQTAYALYGGIYE